MEVADRLLRRLGLNRNGLQSLDEFNVELYRRIFFRVFGQSFASMIMVCVCVCTLESKILFSLQSCIFCRDDG